MFSSYLDAFTSDSNCKSVLKTQRSLFKKSIFRQCFFTLIHIAETNRPLCCEVLLSNFHVSCSMIPSYDPCVMCQVLVLSRSKNDTPKQQWVSSKQGEVYWSIQGQNTHEGGTQGSWTLAVCCVGFLSCFGSRAASSDRWAFGWTHEIAFW
jgi:hypothetical protein